MDPAAYRAVGLECAGYGTIRAVSDRQSYLSTVGVVLESDNFPTKRFTRVDTYLERRGA